MNLIGRLFHSRRRLRSRPDVIDMSNTETYSESFDALPETADREDDSGAGAVDGGIMVRFFFVQGRPGPCGFLLNGTPVREVFVAGDFNGWDPASLPLEQYADGYWEAEIPVPPGRHEYVFVIDGIWRPDPLAESIPNRFGTVNSIITVPVAVCA